MYDEALVERLMPTLWDDSYVMGIQNDSAPDPDMPKAKYKDPRSATDFWCYLIDIRRAWDGASLDWKVRRALYLYFHFGLTMDEIAVDQQVSKKTISKRIRQGVESLAFFLN